MKRKTFYLLALFGLVSASLACALTGTTAPSATPEEGENSATPEVVVVTATPDENEETEAPAEVSEGNEGPTATLKQDLNVRRGPGTGYAIITALSGGTTLDITGVDNTGYWWRVRLPNGQEDWVSASYTDSLNADTVTVVSATPPPSVGGGDHEETPNPTSTPGKPGDSDPTPTPNDREEAGGGDG
jgi:uncharacterized protein YraI